MRRLFVGLATLALLAAILPTSALAAPPTWNYTVTVTGAQILGYNQVVSLGYTLSNAQSGTVVVDNDNGTTQPGTLSTAVTLPTYSATDYAKLLFFIRDTACDVTYYSDGTGTADHVTSSGKTTYYFVDGGVAPACESAYTDVRPTRTWKSAWVTVEVTRTKA